MDAVEADPPEGDQLYVYGAVPPDADRAIDPFVLPQSAGVMVFDTLIAVGSVMVTEAEPMQLEASLTATV